MDEWNRITVEAEARRICDRDGTKDFETFRTIAQSLCLERFREAIQPYMQQKVNISALRLIDRIILKDNGSIDRVEYKPLSPATVETIRLLDELIASEAKRWGLQFQPTGKP